MKALSIITAARLADREGGYIPGVRSYFKLMDLHAGNYWVRSTTCGGSMSTRLPSMSG